MALREEYEKHLKVFRDEQKGILLANWKHREKEEEKDDKRRARETGVQGRCQKSA